MQFSKNFPSKYGDVTIIFTLTDFPHFKETVKGFNVQIHLPQGTQFYDHSTGFVNVGNEMKPTGASNQLELRSRGDMERAYLCIVPVDKPFKKEREFINYGGQWLLDIARPMPSQMK